MSNTKHPIKVIGLSIITTNEAAMTQNTIGKLWQDFSNASIKEKLDNIISPNIFAVYSEYENGYHGKYRITVGYAVDDTANVPAGLTAVMIPTGNYTEYKSKSKSVPDVIDTWKIIWEKNQETYPRDFIADYEEHAENDVTIHIGYK